MTSEKYRISISSNNSFGSSTTPVDFDDFNSFINYLEDKGIKSINLKYYCIIDDSSRFLKNGTALKIEELTNFHFDWLCEKVKGEHRFMEIIGIPNEVNVLKKNMMHKKLMPFREDHLIKYFNPQSQIEHLKYFKESIDNYLKYESDKNNFTKKSYRKYRQAEKDERFYTTRTFISLFERDSKDIQRLLKEILKNNFGDTPPLVLYNKYPTSWDNLLNGEIKLKFEYDVPAPKEYKNHLSINLNKTHFVPYVLDAGTKENNNFRKDLEGPTQIDAYIEVVSSGLKLFIEAKYLSDISCSVSYDVTRNQIARNIDVMLDQEKDKSLFLLITPKHFKERPLTRFYGYKMTEYKNDYRCLMNDLHHRTNLDSTDWSNISKRIAWTTWDDLKDLGLLTEVDK